ncbi:MAG TPA: c-type cytochrome [Gemmatimonadales bacterium]|jgi:mono/diheme cytochrome c family protein/cytochrome c551/c552
MWATNLKVIAVALLTVGFYTLVARSIPQLESEVPEEFAFGADVSVEQLVVAGERVYNGAGGCTACHGLGTRAPNLLTDHAGQGAIGARCGGREPGKDCKAYLYEAMTEPGAFVVDGFENIMPDMRRQIPEDQIWAAIAYLQSLGGEVTVTAADLPVVAEGAGGASGAGGAGGAGSWSTTTDARQLLTEHACLGCHALDGAGPPIGPSFDGIGGRISTDRIRRGIIDPDAEVAEGFAQFAGMMPKAFGDQLSAAQLEILVQFLAGRR